MPSKVAPIGLEDQQQQQFESADDTNGCGGFDHPAAAANADLNSSSFKKPTIGPVGSNRVKAGLKNKENNNNLNVYDLYPALDNAAKDLATMPTAATNYNDEQSGVYYMKHPSQPNNDSNKAAASATSSVTSTYDDEKECSAENDKKEFIDVAAALNNNNDTSIESNQTESMYHYTGQFPVIPEHNLAIIDELCKEMGYQIHQENGQRKFCLIGQQHSQPGKGCEVFIGKIPRDCFEDELIPVLRTIGDIHELRLMMDFSGTTRGFGFVSYFKPEDANKAVAELNNFEIRPGKKIGVCLSIDNCRLFIGGIPKMKSRQEIMDEMSNITEDVVDVIVYPSVIDKQKNRGFAFVEYKTHRAAAMARRRLIPGKINLWGNSVAVDWAEPELEVPKEVMGQVRILYVRNLMLTTSEDTLRNIFAKAADCDESTIERVKKMKDFAFIHFKEREEALKAMENLNNTEIEGSSVEVTLAKPIDKNSHYFNKMNRMNHNGFQNHYNKIPPSYRYFNQLYSQMESQQYSLDDSTTTNVESPLTSPRPPVFHPMTTQHPFVPAANLFYYNQPQAINPPSSFHNSFSCVQLLEDICYANRWGNPVYNISICTSETGVLYSFQVKIPYLSEIYTPELLKTVDCEADGTWEPKDFIAGLEESKEVCAARIISALDSLNQQSISVAAQSLTNRFHAPALAPSQNNFNQQYQQQQPIEKSNNLNRQNKFQNLPPNNYPTTTNTYQQKPPGFKLDTSAMLAAIPSQAPGSTDSFETVLTPNSQNSSQEFQVK